MKSWLQHLVPDLLHWYQLSKDAVLVGPWHIFWSASVLLTLAQLRVDGRFWHPCIFLAGHMSVIGVEGGVQIQRWGSLLSPGRCWLLLDPASWCPWWNSRHHSWKHSKALSAQDPGLWTSCRYQCLQTFERFFSLKLSTIFLDSKPLMWKAILCEIYSADTK